MSKSNVIQLPGIALPNNREPTPAEISSLVEKRDMMIIEAICRTLGHASWKHEEVEKMMATRDYPDGSAVFAFQGKDMLLFEPPMMIEGKLGQPVEYLYDRTDFKYMTQEERLDRGMFEKKTDEELEAELDEDDDTI